MFANRTARSTRAAVVALWAVALVACGDTTGPAGQSGPPAGAASASPPEPAFATPADACTVMPADLAKALKVTGTDRTGSSPLTCTWKLDSGDRHKARTIGVTYEAWDELRLAKSTYEASKRTDIASGRGANVTIRESGDVDQVGTQRQGQHYDEGYYFYGTSEIAGMTLGNGTVVLRRGNVTLTITAQGNDVLPPYTGKLRSNPLVSAEAKQMIDRTADAFAAAVSPAVTAR
ncbi:hypothetical protein [Virgisporangium aurantiacum]|uniref:DUF3558 domain-containing protein n=1 Tax=Virgisporangium aurantiacum TaxID=175570 RepID=A0A8J3Z9L8_9ACTN|nr:hypothetical protein [Virgisporangium aurantiacum]GIJ57470.1 hypothetical protein Vau01_049860 [Virgisporangium aurantiacum]